MWSCGELQCTTQERTPPLPRFGKERGSDFFKILGFFFFYFIELKREKNPHPVLYFTVRKLSICTAWELTKELRNTNGNAYQFVGSESSVGIHWRSVWAWEARFVGSIGEGWCQKANCCSACQDLGKGQSPVRQYQHPAEGGEGGAEGAEKHSANRLGCVRRESSVLQNMRG